VRASDDLRDFFQPWLELKSQELAFCVREKWKCYVNQRLNDDVFTVMDGQLFHGDLTNLFMMEMSEIDLNAHVSELMEVINPLNPLLIYFRHIDLQRAIRSVFAARGAKWESYQFDWKLQSPYASNRMLRGLEGFTAMYEKYRTLTDSLFASLNCQKLMIDTDIGSWPMHYKKITCMLEAAGVHV
jgi:hypothetical protein